MNMVCCSPRTAETLKSVGVHPGRNWSAADSVFSLTNNGGHNLYMTIASIFKFWYMKMQDVKVQFVYREFVSLGCVSFM